MGRVPGIRQDAAARAGADRRVRGQHPVRQPDPAARLGLDENAAGLVRWDVFDAVLSPGDRILMLSWRDEAAASAYEAGLALPDGARLRRVRIVRDYGMYDRRENPQFYREVSR